MLASADPAVAPDIRMNYFSDPHDMTVMVAILRRVLDIVDSWPDPSPRPADRAACAGRKTRPPPGDEPSDALLEDLARHYAFTVYHLTSTCRIGDVVDSRLRVVGVAACASPTPASCPTWSAATPTPPDHDRREGGRD